MLVGVAGSVNPNSASRVSSFWMESNLSLKSEIASKPSRGFCQLSSSVMVPAIGDEPTIRLDLVSI